MPPSSDSSGEFVVFDHDGVLKSNAVCWLLIASPSRLSTIDMEIYVKWRMARDCSSIFVPTLIP